MIVSSRCLWVLLCPFILSVAWSAPPFDTRPVDGLHVYQPNVVAITHARIVTGPGEVIEEGTLVIRDGSIIDVGIKVQPPVDAKVINGKGWNIYPGFIDAYGEATVNASAGGAKHWNSAITPEVNVNEQYQADSAANEKLRGQGFVCRLVAPSNGIIKGTSAIVSTGSSDNNRAILNPDTALHMRLAVPRNRTRGSYPSSPMGAVALARQTWLDALWYRQAWSAHQSNLSLPRPERNDALDQLTRYLDGQRLVIIDAVNELYLLRASAFANEFSLQTVLRGNGQEYQQLEAVRDSWRRLIIPVNFPRPPLVSTPEAIQEAGMDDLLHWHFAPENPKRLVEAGVPIAFTSFGLLDTGRFLSQVRLAVERGLSPDDALRAMTSTPAQWFNISSRYGAIAAGKSASFVVTDGDLFSKQTKILSTWIEGQEFEQRRPEPLDIRGTWSGTTTNTEGTSDTFSVEITSKAGKLSGVLKVPGEDGKSQEIKYDKIELNDHQVTASFPGKAIGQTGTVQVSATLIIPKGDTPWTMSGTIAWPDGKIGPFQATRTTKAASRSEKSTKSSASDKDETKPDEAKSESRSDEKPKSEATEESPDNKEQDTKEDDADESQASKFVVNYPLGAWGRTAPPEQPAAVLFKNATVWTCGPQGTQKSANVLVERGRISAIGPEVKAPEGAVEVDATGKHLAPGIIDCHSHMGTDGGINEGTQAITAEVRVGDFIDSNDIDIYRQLAGGVTCANVLHGSANPIGGQNQVIKLRWGRLLDELKFAEAPAGIKFALGENVKRSNSTDDPTRYPGSRMGVEQLIRDAFQSAKDYRAQWKRYETKHDILPPRKDLELEALAEIVEGKRWVHCHSYRQDEILALLRTCEEFGIRIATLQHILEGYKVADVMARHGAMGSSFSDWWAYKVEAYDAIPYNGALMHQAGVVVSFNSDDRELARHLNHEAAKAMKYGQIAEDEALKFVTINPARQLRIDQYVGSIEVGKHADMVLWSDAPLSLKARCEQTWIDGAKYFDRIDDEQRRKEIQSMRASLVQLILKSGQTARTTEESAKPPEEMVDREDIYCQLKNQR